MKAELAEIHKETHRANVSPSNQNFNSTTNRDNSISAGKPLKGVVSKSCAEDESKVINKAKGLPKSQNHKSYTNRDNGISAVNRIRVEQDSESSLIGMTG